ncbi:hypothetical protein ACWGJ9_10960 [Curtobacterium citreum]
MTNISSGAENARESARKTDGKFGQQQRPEAEGTLQLPEPQLERTHSLDAAKVELDGALRRVDNAALSAIGATFKKHVPQVHTLELSRRFGTWQVTAARDENHQMHTFPDVTDATSMLTKDFHTRDGVTALNDDLVHVTVADAYDRPDPSDDWTIAEASEAIGGARETLGILGPDADILEAQVRIEEDPEHYGFEEDDWARLVEKTGSSENVQTALRHTKAWEAAMETAASNASSLLTETLQDAVHEVLNGE